MNEVIEETSERDPLFYVLTAGLICFSTLFLVGTIARLSEPPDLNGPDAKAAANLRLEAQELNQN
jgi:hypothetical protein